MAVSVQMYGIQTLKPTTDSTFNLIYNPNVRPENNNEVRLLVDTSLQVVPAAVNINLPAISQFNGIFTLQLYVIDVNGSAGAFPINIIPAVNDDIDGGSGVSISTNNGNIVLTIAADGYWTTYGSSGSGGGGGGVVTTTYSDFYNQLSAASLVTGTIYRITDYRSVNFVNGGYNVINPASQTFEAGSFDNNFTRNFLDSVGNTFYFVNQDTFGNIYTGDTGGRFYKTNSNGVIDSSFSANVGTGGSGNAVNDVAFQTDNKIIVVGNFPNWNTSIPTGSIVRLNQNGTLDNAYQTAIGTGFDSTIISCAIQPDNSIVVVGTFTNFNGAPVAKGIARITSAGALDAAFNANLGAGLDALGVAYGVTIQNDGKILVSGQFTSVAGVTSQGVVRLNADGTVDAAFAANINNPSGFTGIVQTIVQQPDGKILCGGSFTDFNGNTYNRLARLNADGTDDVVFNTNIGTAFNDSILSIALDGSNNIICGGDFTNWNTTIAVGKVVRISPSGFLDGTFICPISDNRVYGIIVQSSGNIVVSGNWTYFVNGEAKAQYLFRLLDTSTTTTSTLDDIHIGATETLLVIASSANTIQQNVYSEQFPYDIIEYIPQCNTLSLPLPIFNGTTLPDSSIVAGFDLQWDGTNAYFELPANYPFLYGYFFYIYFDTVTSYYENYIRISTFGVNSNPLGNVGEIGNSTININSNNIKITLSGITLEQFNNYVTNSLYVDSVYSKASAYGWITKRYSGDANICFPYDWRSRKFRRYTGKATAAGSWSSVYASIGVSSTDFYFSGLFDDFLTINTGYAEDIIFNETLGGTSYGYWYGAVDNIVFLGTVAAVRFDGVIYVRDNTWNSTSTNIRHNISYFDNNIFTDFVSSVTINCRNVSGNIMGQVISTDFYGSQFTENNFYGSLTQSSLNGIIANNDIVGDVLLLTTLQIFSSNAITGNINNFVANSFESNIIQASNIADCNIERFFSNNIVTPNFQNVQGKAFEGNNMNAPVQIRRLLFDLFSNNQISCNEMDKNNFVGSFFSNVVSIGAENFINNNFNCTLCQANTFNGGKFESNNIVAAEFTSNNFELIDFRFNNISSEIFKQNNFNVGGITTVGVGHNNIECGTFEFNTIKKDMAFNNIQGYFRVNILNGNFNLNNISGTFDGNTTALAQQFRTNTFEQTVVINVDFSASTYVYAGYNCFVFTGNALTLLLEYYDEGTSTWSVVAMTA